MPKRIQRKRTKGWRMPPNTVYVGRPSQWGNPWSPANTVHVVMRRGRVERSRASTWNECVELYREDVEDGTFGYTPEDVRIFLGGWNLACWCPPDRPCHADVLLEMAN